MENTIQKAGILLWQFAEESNKIEGIHRAQEHDDAALRLVAFLKLEYLTVGDLNAFNTAGKLRDTAGMDVRVGGHRPISGGTYMLELVEELLDGVVEENHPYQVHQEFETLHPYTDGNGRTGRAIWLWQMVNQRDYNMSLGFLHTYYYQSLQATWV